MANALSRRVTWLNTLTVTVTTRLDNIKPKYLKDVKLSPIYAALISGGNLQYPDYSLKDGFLFHYN